MEQELYKSRSLSSCVKTAYDIVFNNAKTIIRKTWLVAIVIAAISSFLPVVYCPTPLGLSLTAIVLVLSIIANATLLATIATLLNSNNFKHNIKRTLSMSAVVSICAIATIAILIAAFLLTTQWAISSASSTPLTYAYIAIGILTIIFAIVWIPASYSCMNYIYNKKSSLTSIFGHPYAIGFKAWGMLFMVHLILGIIAALLYIPLFAIPNTLMLADITNATSMALGDADGLPTGFMALYYFSTFIATLLMSYVCLWGHIVMYFTFGTISFKQANKLQSTQITDSHEQ